MENNYLKCIMLKYKDEYYHKNRREIYYININSPKIVWLKPNIVRDVEAHESTSRVVICISASPEHHEYFSIEESTERIEAAMNVPSGEIANILLELEVKD